MTGLEFYAVLALGLAAIPVGFVAAWLALCAFYGVDTVLERATILLCGAAITLSNRRRRLRDRRFALEARRQRVEQIDLRRTW